MTKKLAVVYKSGDARLDNSFISLTRAIGLATSSLEANGISTDIKWMPREKMNISQLRGTDCILIAGGDGTFLSTSHLILDETPVLGVNTDTEKSVGFYLKSDLATVSRDIETILTEKPGKAYYIHTLPRLSATIETQSGNVINTDLALNDLLIANTVAYYPSKYRISFVGKDENQSSSGVIVFTRAGFSGWARNVLKRDLNMGKNQFGFVVREPMGCTLVEGILGKNDDLVLESDMHRGFAVPDSFDEYHFGRGSKITIRLVERSLNVVAFSKDFIGKRPPIMERPRTARLIADK